MIKPGHRVNISMTVKAVADGAAAGKVQFISKYQNLEVDIKYTGRKRTVKMSPHSLEFPPAFPGRPVQNPKSNEVSRRAAVPPLLFPSGKTRARNVGCLYRWCRGSMLRAVSQAKKKRPGSAHKSLRGSCFAPCILTRPRIARLRRR